MTSGVYAIVNTVTGMVYVGSSRNIEVRWKGRRNALRLGKSTNKHLQAEWTTARGKGFVLQVLEQVDDVQGLTAAEQRWLDQYEGRCYNIRKRVWRSCEGGPDCPCYGCWRRRTIADDQSRATRSPASGPAGSSAEGGE